jgi:hypothetical protein
MILLPYYTAFPGQLPVMAELSVTDVFFSEAATAKKVMCFDMQLAVATSYNPLSAPNAAGQGTSAWAYVRDYDVDTATLHHSEVDIYCVADAAVSANAKGSVTVCGYVTNMVKLSATGATGQGYTPSMGTVGSLAPQANTPTTLVAGARNRKVIFKQVGADVSATRANGQFNGLGWGWSFCNVAVNAD